MTKLTGLPAADSSGWVSHAAPPQAPQQPILPQTERLALTNVARRPVFVDGQNPFSMDEKVFFHPGKKTADNPSVSYEGKTLNINGLDAGSTDPLNVNFDIIFVLRPGNKYGSPVTKLSGSIYEELRTRTNNSVGIFVDIPHTSQVNIKNCANAFTRNLQNIGKE